MPEDKPMLQLKNVSKSFTRNAVTVEALRNISFDVFKGEFISIVGASGCGKSTLLSIVDGLLPKSSGEVLLNGTPVQKPGPDRAFVFQSDSLFPWRSVEDNIIFGLQVQGVAKKAALENTHKFIELVGLKGFEQYYPHELSGGMRQRVNFARALAIDPALLLMDEPFAALDAQTREIMQSELLKIWQQTMKTVLFITHQIDEAVYLSDKVFVFSARPGQIKEIIPIDLPRPRSLHIKRTPEFLTYTDHIWNLIEDEVRQGMQLSS